MAMAMAKKKAQQKMNKLLEQNEQSEEKDGTESEGTESKGTESETTEIKKRLRRAKKKTWLLAVAKKDLGYRKGVNMNEDIYKKIILERDRLDEKNSC